MGDSLAWKPYEGMHMASKRDFHLWHFPNNANHEISLNICMILHSERCCRARLAAPNVYFYRHPFEGYLYGQLTSSSTLQKCFQERSCSPCRAVRDAVLRGINHSQTPVIIPTKQQNRGSTKDFSAIFKPMKMNYWTY